MPLTDHGAEAAKLLNCDSSWLPRLVAVLQRDFPAQLHTAMSRAITENARRNAS